MSDHLLNQEMWDRIDEELHSCVNSFMSNTPAEFKEMIEYQLGWIGGPKGVTYTGKRIRPLFLLLVHHALGGEWQNALPAAAAVELIHNFSLIHDDIQDKSATRRGRDTVWVKWGEPLAINAGDAMQTLANLEAQRIKEHFPDSTTIQVLQKLQEANLLLTEGQYLDLKFEDVNQISLDDYHKMISGKTGALLSFCFGAGALLLGKTQVDYNRYFDFGMLLGNAFQIQDDWLGIWGDQSQTGKSTASDILMRKKTYPILIALEQNMGIKKYWEQRPKFYNSDVIEIVRLMNETGLKSLISQKIESLFNELEKKFEGLFQNNELSEPLQYFIFQIAGRNH